MGAAQYAFGLFIDPLEQSFGWSRTEISASLSFAAVSGLVAPVLGRAMDRHGVRLVLAGSLAIGGVGFVLRPWMSELWHWYVLSLLQFVAFAGATVLPAGKLVALWFPRTRGRVMAIAAMGNNVGGLVVPPTVVAVLSAFTWREGYLALAVASFILALLALGVVREPTVAASGAGRGTEGGRSASPAGGVLTGVTAGQAVRSRAFYAVLGAVMLGSFTYSTILPAVLAHLVNSGVPLARASFALGALAVGGVAGKLVFGFLAERLGARRAAILDLSGQALLATGLALAGPGVLVVLTPCFGLFMGGFGVLIALLVQDTFGVRHFGSIMGLVNTSTVVSFGLGPLMAGASFDLTGGYGAAFVTTAILFAAGGTVLGLTPLPAAGGHEPARSG